MPRIATPLLPAVLSHRDLSPAELAAARLDGQLLGYRESFVPVDAIDSATHRAESVPHLASSRFIAERSTAAWILGAIDTSPAPISLCLDSRDKTRAPRLDGCRIREVVIDASEWVVLGRARSTTALRTAIDLARHEEHIEVEVLSRLLRLGTVGRADVVDALLPERRLSHRERALDRLTAALLG